MPKQLILVLENSPIGHVGSAMVGTALGRVVEAHPALEPLMDFAGPDPLQIAVQIGVAYAYDPEDVADLAEIDFGPVDWHEPSAGLVVIQKALDAVRADPSSIAAAVYDPGLRPADVLADLESLEQQLRLAFDGETRFRLILAS